MMDFVLCAPQGRAKAHAWLRIRAAIAGSWHRRLGYGTDLSKIEALKLRITPPDARLA
jgi:hypothetical protein